MIIKSEEFLSCYLISMPQMEDPRFSQTVSLLFQFDLQGAMALVLNKETQITLGQAFEGDPLSDHFSKRNLYWGGPVDNQQLFILHDAPDLSEGIQLSEELFLSSSVETLKELDQRSSKGYSHFRLYSGYAGWGKGQLEEEISQSSWLTAPLETHSLFDGSSQTLWKDVIKASGIELSQLSSLDMNPDGKNIH
ncbi:MAG: YqgE/AlgH family protein [Bdellovibrionota bacterium]